MQWPLVQAADYTAGRRQHPRLIVVHDMEVLDSPSTAEGVGNYFATGHPQASAHVGVDQNSVEQYVRFADTAWAAPGANHDGVHIELPGRSLFDAGAWGAEDSALNLGSCVAAVFVGLMRFLGAPVEIRRLSPGEIADGHTAGFCGHNDVTAAFNTPGGHTDPGEGFPWNVWFDKVNWWLAQFDQHGYPSPAPFH